MKINIPELVAPYLPYAAVVVLIFIFIFVSMWAYEIFEDSKKSQPPDKVEEETKAEMARLGKHIKAKIEREIKETRKDWS